LHNSFFLYTGSSLLSFLKSLFVCFVSSSRPLLTCCVLYYFSYYSLVDWLWLSGYWGYRFLTDQTE
jgi:hypothetical protein